MKILAVASGNGYFKIGDTLSKSKWYKTIKVIEAIKLIDKGDEVEITFEEDINKEKILTSIKKIASAVVEKEDVKPTEVVSKDEVVNINPLLKMPFDYMKPKTPVESEQIKRLSILSSVATAITALAGQIDETTIIPKMEEIYNKFYKVVSV